MILLLLKRPYKKETARQNAAWRARATRRKIMFVSQSRLTRTVAPWLRVTPRALSTLSSPSPANNALSPTIFETAADNFLGAWSDDDGHGCGLRMPPLRPSVLPALDCLDDVFRVHDAMIQSPQSDRLGGHAGWKLGWKGNPLVTADPSRLPAMYSPIFAGCLFPSGTTLSLSHHKVFCAEAEFGFVMGSPLPPREVPRIDWEGHREGSTAHSAAPQACQKRTHNLCRSATPRRRFGQPSARTSHVSSCAGRASPLPPPRPRRTTSWPTP